MNTKPQAESPDAAKSRYGRQIDEAFEEVSRLAGSSLTPTEFYEQFLNRTLSAIDAAGGVVWLRTPQGFLQMACQQNLDKVGLDAKRGGRQCHNEILRQVFQSQPARPQMVEPQGRLQGVNTEPGAVPAANLTDYYALFAPIVNNEKQPFGLLEVFQDPALDPRLYHTFLQYAVQMAGYASQYHAFSNARQASGLEKILTQIESFSKQIHSSLNPTEVAYHVANEGRRLIECDRLCVGVRHGRKVTVEAVSGADVVEKASTHVRRMRALFDAVLKFGDKLVYKGNKDEGLPPDLSHALDEYLAESQPKLLVVTPVRDDREKDNGKPARSVLLMESFNPPEQVEPMVQKLDVVGKHSAGALYNAAEMKRVPFGVIWRPLGKLQEGIGGKGRFYTALVVTAIVLLAGILVLVPYPLKMDSKGSFQPTQLIQIYSPTEGEITGISVKPGDKRKPNAGLLTLYSPALQQKYMEAARDVITAQRSIEDLEQSRSKQGLTAEAEQSLIREISKNKATVQTRTEYLQFIQRSYGMNPGQPGEFVVRTPGFDPSIQRTSDDWRVLSGEKRDELLHKTVRQMEPLLTLGNVDGPWRVELKLPQRTIGHVARALADPALRKNDKSGKAYLDVDVLLTNRPDASYPGRLYAEDMPGEAVANKDDHNESEPVLVTYVRVNSDDVPDDQKIPRELFVAGVEAHCKVKCGDHALGYSLFHGVWEWFYEKVVFFF